MAEQLSPPMLDKVQRQVVAAITFGNILEWYDIYLYVYWAPTLAKILFSSNSEQLNLFNTVVCFLLGFIFRPLGGLIFGYLGDHVGRRKSFILSILLMTFPTFLLGLIPTYEQVGIWSPVILGICRIFQTFPAGGELPGAFCYLYENADIRNRKFMTSFAGVGNQIGIALSVVECFLMEKLLPPDILEIWGWRISFTLGGFIGLAGIFLRKRLHETRLFHEASIHHKMCKSPLIEVLRKNWRKILKGMSYGTAQTVSFHFISIIFPIYFYKLFGVSEHGVLVSSMCLLILMTLPLPFFGFLGDKFGAKKLVLFAVLLMSCLLYPFYVSVKLEAINYIVGIMGCYVLCLACLTALWPYLLAHLFRTPVRYTCIGLSFNMADGMFGGLTTMLAFYMLHNQNNLDGFFLILFVCCMISLLSYSYTRAAEL